MFNTPVLFLIFNRPQLTKSVFAAIQQQKPAKLYIAADGPRINIDNEKEKCYTTRNFVLNNIDWGCQVKTLFRDENIGCGRAVSEAITWFFQHEDEGIILEDDCLPNESFFTFCSEMISRYRENNDVMMISGTSYQLQPMSEASYYFSSYVHIWGWATWRRAWQKYHFSLDSFDAQRCDKLLKHYFASDERKMWIDSFNMIRNGFDTWDYQWMYAIWTNGGMTIIPWQNMISNLGFGAEATHTSYDSTQAEMTRYELKRIVHPTRIKLNHIADRYERRTILMGSIKHRLKRRIRLTIKKYIGL